MKWGKWFVWQLARVYSDKLLWLDSSCGSRRRRRRRGLSAGRRMARFISANHRRRGEVHYVDLIRQDRSNFWTQKKPALITNTIEIEIESTTPHQQAVWAVQFGWLIRQLSSLSSSPMVKKMKMILRWWCYFVLYFPQRRRIIKPQSTGWSGPVRSARRRREKTTIIILQRRRWPRNGHPKKNYWRSDGDHRLIAKSFRITFPRHNETVSFN